MKLQFISLAICFFSFANLMFGQRYFNPHTEYISNSSKVLMVEQTKYFTNVQIEFTNTTLEPAYFVTTPNGTPNDFFLKDNETGKEYSLKVKYAEVEILIAIPAEKIIINYHFQPALDSLRDITVTEKTKSDFKSMVNKDKIFEARGIRLISGVSTSSAEKLTPDYNSDLVVIGNIFDSKSKMSFSPFVLAYLKANSISIGKNNLAFSLGTHITPGQLYINGMLDYEKELFKINFFTERGIIDSLQIPYREHFNYMYAMEDPVKRQKFIDGISAYGMIDDNRYRLHKEVFPKIKERICNILKAKCSGDSDAKINGENTNYWYMVNNYALKKRNDGIWITEYPISESKDESKIIIDKRFFSFLPGYSKDNTLVPGKFIRDKLPDYGFYPEKDSIKLDARLEELKVIKREDGTIYNIDIDRNGDYLDLSFSQLNEFLIHLFFRFWKSDVYFNHDTRFHDAIDLVLPYYAHSCVPYSYLAAAIQYKKLGHENEALFCLETALNTMSNKYYSQYEWAHLRSKIYKELYQLYYERGLYKDAELIYVLSSLHFNFTLTDFAAEEVKYFYQELMPIASALYEMELQVEDLDVQRSAAEGGAFLFRDILGSSTHGLPRLLSYGYGWSQRFESKELERMADNLGKEVENISKLNNNIKYQLFNAKLEINYKNELLYYLAADISELEEMTIRILTTYALDKPEILKSIEDNKNSNWSNWDNLLEKI